MLRLLPSSRRLLAQRVAFRGESFQRLSANACLFSTKVVDAASTPPSLSTVSDEPSKLLLPDSFRKLHNISLLDSKDNTLSKDQAALYDPIQSFEHPLISPKLTSVFVQGGFTAPTHIQSQTWPIVMANKDVIAVARTGSGKTYGYLLPTIQSAFINAPSNTSPTTASPVVNAAATGANASTKRGALIRRRITVPKILIMAPTRELSMQILNETLKFSKPLRLMAEVFYGGVSKFNQIKSLNQGVDIVIGTPGRIFDMINMGNLDPREIKHLILDEADRMLDMGFEPQIRDIVDKLPVERQTVFYTATWPKEVVALSRQYLKDPIRILIGDQGKLNANKNITQHCIVMKPFEKREKLIDILVKLSEHTGDTAVDTKDASRVGSSGMLKKKAIPKTLIFVSTKVACDDIAEFLNGEGFATKPLHGGMSQNVREAIVHQFRRGTANIVVATDVASRGLDIKDIEIVVNYDFPTDGVESYVHRIGRTGRGENKGHSVTFVTQSDFGECAELIELLKRSNQEVPGALQSLAEQYAALHNPKPRFSRYGSGGGGRGGGDRGGDRRGGGRGGGGGFGGDSSRPPRDRDQRESRFSDSRPPRRFDQGDDDAFGGERRRRNSSSSGGNSFGSSGDRSRGRGRDFEVYEENSEGGDRRSSRSRSSSQFSSRSSR